jgi:hypothetical protein
MREHFIVPSIRSREVACAQRYGIRLREDVLKALDFGYGLLGVQSVTISNRTAGRSIRSGISKDRDLRCS